MLCACSLVAWLQWQLQGDSRAAAIFVGANCGLCSSPEWHVSKKQIDAPSLAFAFELRATVDYVWATEPA